MKHLILGLLLLAGMLTLTNCATQDLSSNSISSEIVSSEVQEEKANEDLIEELVDKIKDVFK